MFGSGQWTIFEGCAAAKLWKAGFRSNNIDPNARHRMASAVAGFMRTFGIDEPMGCYDDIEQADAFVLWARTWPRCTPSREPHHRPAAAKPQLQGGGAVHFRTPQFRLADQGIIFAPQTDLAILNYIANYPSPIQGGYRSS